MKNEKIFILILLFGYMVTQSALAQEQDSVMTKWLNDVEVVAKRELYTMRPDVMIYHVNADSSLVRKNSYEALRNVPLLHVERNGTVRSIGGWPIEYLVNGAHDFSLAGNIQDVLETLDAKYLKRIEARITRNVEGQEVLEINLVTKGRLLGYRGTANSELSDEKWRNGAYLFTKRNRLGISLWYHNTWMWEHDNKRKVEEWRYGHQDLYHTERETKESGYKVDLNNLEMNLSYEITPLKLFSVYTRALLKANPHTTATTDCKVESDAAVQTYRYKHEQNHKADRDAEYDVTLEYEHLFGENAKHGKFYAGYEFYYRPVKSHTDKEYSLLEYVDPTYVKDFFNNKEWTSSDEKWHTFNMLYRRKISSHQFFVEDDMRYRDEGNSVLQEQFYNFNPDMASYCKTDREEYKHWQFMNALRMGYGYNHGKIGVNAGAIHVFMRDSSQEPLLQNSFSKNRQMVTPYTDLSYAMNGKTSFRLAYAMGRQVPDIQALNPYVNTEVPGRLSYGNPNLKPQTAQSFSLSSNLRIGKFNLYASSTHSFAKDLILQHSFLKDDILHITMNNIGKRYENQTQATVSSKIFPTTWMQVDTKLYYTDYAENAYYQRNRGCTFSVNASFEQELPHNFDLSVSGGYNTPYIYMQGKGEENFYYNIGIYKSFPKKRLTISAEANSFLPIYYTNVRENRSADYYSVTHNRSFHASFRLSLRWRFGKMKAEERQIDESINHEDIKRHYDE
ncbi:MAG: outer membrane beta-barrel family protein [Bacteroidaceae bacterium]|nr:outer membrane beta-barrel family protein [Bacteroidaceae bacterium]